MKGDYGKDQKENEEDEKNGGEHVEYDKESVELLMLPVLTLEHLFIGGFVLAEASWVPSR